MMSNLWACQQSSWNLIQPLTRFYRYLKNASRHFTFVAPRPFLVMYIRKSTAGDGSWHLPNVLREKVSVRLKDDSLIHDVTTCALSLSSVNSPFTFLNRTSWRVEEPLHCGTERPLRQDLRAKDARNWLGVWLRALSYWRPLVSTVDTLSI